MSIAEVAEIRTATLNLTDVAHGGEAVGRVDNQVVFVPLGVPGEQVVVELYGERKRYARGRILEVLSPSRQRVEPRCPYFGQCGGCQWQHVDYGAQLEFKRRILATQLQRIGGFADPPVQSAIPDPSPWNYRNHARFSLGEGGRLGFTRLESRDFQQVDYCHLMQPVINEILGALQGRCPPAHHLAVRCGRTGDVAVSPELPPGLIPYPSGQTALEEVLGGRRFRISGPSFFQVNTEQAERLVEVVRQALGDLEPNLLVDAYCGVGTFALLLADRAQRVIGIEEAGSAVKDARRNAADVGNVTFLQGKTERVLPEIGEHVDVVILDPARVGCHPRVVWALLKLQPSMIVYVSCDPATLARDLKLLCAGPYRLVDVQPVDMFSQTYHVECVATLRLR